MYRRNADVALGLVLAAVTALELRAQSPAPTPQSGPPASQPASAASKPAAAKRGPKYEKLRYDDDFTYLDGPPESYTPDIFDPIKNIRIGEDWRMEFGGEYRVMLQGVMNRRFGDQDPSQDTIVLRRGLVHVSARYRKLIRIYFEGIDSRAETVNIAKQTFQENRWDFHQFFADLRFLGEDVPLTLRVGRQEMLYGKERLVGISDTSNTRRRFEGAKILWDDGKLKADVFYVRPVPVDADTGGTHTLDDYDEQSHFYGSHWSWKLNKDHGVDAYVFAHRHTGDLTNPNGHVGDLSLYTVGSRFWGKTGPWDYETEVSGQWGKFAGDTVQAWHSTADTGWTFDLPAKPRAGAGFIITTGDRNATDGMVQTYDPLFATGLTPLDNYVKVGTRPNIISPNVNVSIKPHDALTARAAYHMFWLTQVQDALYTSPRSVLRRDPTGGAGREVGSELDLALEWTVDAHSTFLFGYSHYWDSDVIQATGASENVSLLYFQYTLRF
ncbi:MAG: hypothetical protein CHACPFDD_00554 [Phycisphaerae bacterium]|nr:hypothetical protein [Phycisphaerae bacterium]